MQMQAAAALKEAGAAAVARRDYAGALTQYTAALEALAVAGSSGDGVSPASNDDDAAHLLAAQLHSNASLCELELGNPAAALAHAATAVSHRPDWAKAHLRKAAALSALARHREAAAAFAVALALDPSTAASVGHLRDAATRRAEEADRVGPITTLDRFVEAYRHSDDRRLRLATLAHAWNMLSLPERYDVLRAFLFIVGGAAALDESLPEGDRPSPHISGFRRDGLAPLPLANYADITVPPAWLEFFSSLPAVAAPTAAAGGAAPSPPHQQQHLPPRVELLRRLWDACDAVEQGLIVDDMRSFYGAPGGGSAAAGTSDGGGDDDVDMADAAHHATSSAGRPPSQRGPSASGAGGEFAAVTQLLERLAVGGGGSADGPAVTSSATSTAPSAAGEAAAAPAAHRPARRRES